MLYDVPQKILSSPGKFGEILKQKVMKEKIGTGT